MIPVTKPYLPCKEKFKQYVDRIYDSGHLTNSGPMLRELEQRLSDYLGVKHVICVANGSLALQLAYKALDVTGEVITTPFSFAATSSTLLWEGLTPVFSDIDADTFNLDPQLIEANITPSTSAILPVHVFGNPCDVEAIRQIADQYGLKVIYDAAHAFGVQYKGESVLKWGDISTLSFHATKLFHTIEGGAVLTECDKTAQKVRQLINFGITGPDTIEGIGTNAKMNEFEAAMGLCVLDDIHEITERRQGFIDSYKAALGANVTYQKESQYTSKLASYMPVVFDSEQSLNRVKAALEDRGIYPRRYFYPSLDSIYAGNAHCPCSNKVSERILCLPLMHALPDDTISLISDIIEVAK